MSADEIEARGYNLDIKNPHTEEEDLRRSRGPSGGLLSSAEAEVVSVRDQLKRILAESAVADERRASSSPSTTAWRTHRTPLTVMHRFVLDLAVRGKLVAQDPADEPASELLKHGLPPRRREW